MSWVAILLLAGRCGIIIVIVLGIQFHSWILGSHLEGIIKVNCCLLICDGLGERCAQEEICWLLFSCDGGVKPWGLLAGCYDGVVRLAGLL